MKPHNSADRNSAFRTFLLFFIITITLAATAVFSSMQVPFEENNQLKAAMKVAENNNSFTQSFSENVANTIRLLDTVNLPNVNADKIDRNIDENIAVMRMIITNDSSVAAKNFYKNVADNLEDLKKARKQIREATSISANVEKLQNENERLQYQLKSATDNYQSCQLALSYLQKQ